ncbi:MAG: hypothetical protein K2X82_32735 [Gemmataceae bacterium]|nr:hypothetical protein [Gemmataceae bacterium]
MNRKAGGGVVLAAAALAAAVYLLWWRTSPVPEEDPLPIGGGDVTVTRVEYQTPSLGRAVTKPEGHWFGLPWYARGPVVLTGVVPAGADAVRSRLSLVDVTALTETPPEDLPVTATGPRTFQVEVPAERIAPATVNRVVFERTGSPPTAYEFTVANAPTRR